ncbi:hypothetical protein HanRHA438_Chr06g0267881 [Helianthus annuus]|uniref:mediator of RNA polymerase II transcription subunit 15a isoform X2 n=1 Tax=Helianthus annuus TaxID=4232 RepID=UPI000B8F5234|nr:mediator of RNA polymerase II transcription subunit 15a isoform X2 [Helianthus annuus]KAJ0560514.1 putative mediator of RNA polymerase II transcription subunit 15a/b/c [Helianthus annuus]KAJ0566873.1 hypothetical protein HanIR_Chr06g0278431 [Helianthus annuus]KAJ0573543.1 putative mediator of RNA polymerase II transcription subunit 15a/b/c [Helianthus annuus]KAJ0737906.1 putative mediator of RNA polymerase II transcription subunit 15a/b/c [Helianthus annuus]KAJ0740791.1 putative mediator of
MMNTDSSEPAFDWDFDLDSIDFESLFEDQLADALTNSSEDATTINPNNPSQPSTPSIIASTNLGGESSNAVTGSSGNLISGGGRQQETYINLNFPDPVGFTTDGQFRSATAHHHYILRQIKVLKDRYHNELLKMNYKAAEMRTWATNMDESNYYESVITDLGRIMTFLNITRADLLPNNEQMIYNIMNTIVNYVSYHMYNHGFYSLHREPAHQPLKGPQVQPLGAMRLQNNPSPNPTHRVTNLEVDMWNFNHNFPLERPRPQPSQSRMPSLATITSFQIVPHPSVPSTRQQIHLGPMTSSVIGSSYPISVFSNTTSTNFPSGPLIHQPPVANQNFNFEKMKAPMHKTDELTGSKVRHEMSPLGLGLGNQCTSTQCSLPHSTASSPFLLSSNTSAPSKTPMDPPSQEPETSKDQAFHLTEVVKPSTALISSLTDISSIEKVTDIIPHCVPPNLVSTHIQDATNVKYDHEPVKKRKRKSSVPLAYSDQFVSQGRDKCSTESSTNKMKKIENPAILEEIKEVNSKLLETSMEIDPSEDGNNILGAHEGTIVKCLFRNVCSLLGPQKGASSEKMPEFVILLLVPDNYPASSPKMIKSSLDVLNNEPWGTLYDEMLIKFNVSLCGITGIHSLGDMARNWDASARAVVNSFLQKKGGKSFSEKYGSWDNFLKFFHH